MIKENCIDNIKQQYHLKSKTMFLYQSRLKPFFLSFSSFLSVNYVAIVVKSKNIDDDDYDDKDCGHRDLF
jgi:hypothetical protein